MEIIWGLPLVVLLVATNAFFVAAEFALVSVRRSRIEELVASGVPGAESAQRAVRSLDRYIAGTQIGITIASLGLGWIGEPAIAVLIYPLFEFVPVPVPSGLIHTFAYACSFAIITFCHVVFGELVPKSIALQSTETVALRVGWPMGHVVIIFRPLIAALNGAGNLVLRMIGYEPASEFRSVHSVDELGILVQQSHKAGVLDDLERGILERTFHFSELRASAITTPRADIAALNLDDPLPELLNELASSEHTRLPAYEGSIDHIVGIIHVHDVFRALRSERGLQDLREIMRQPFIVPEGIHLDLLVEQFRQQRTKMAIVLDEYGATAGLVTFKDIVEEVFGAVQKAPQGEIPAIQKLPDGRTLVRGDLRLDELQRELGWDLLDKDVETVAGLIMKRLGRVAEVNDVVTCLEGTIRVLRMKKLRIIRVALEPRPKDR